MNDKKREKLKRQMIKVPPPIYKWSRVPVNDKERKKILKYSMNKNEVLTYKFREGDQRIRSEVEECVREAIIQTMKERRYDIPFDVYDANYATELSKEKTKELLNNLEIYKEEPK